MQPLHRAFIRQARKRRQFESVCLPSFVVRLYKNPESVEIDLSINEHRKLTHRHVAYLAYKARGEEADYLSIGVFLYFLKRSRIDVC